MPAEETPPNSPCMNSDLNENEDISFDENDIVELYDDQPEPTVEEEDENEEDETMAEGSEEHEEISDQKSATVVYKEHSRDVLSCHFHPKSRDMVATGGTDDKAFVWDSKNGNTLFECKGHNESVEVVSFSYDGSYLATADLNGVIKIWRTKDFKLIETFELDDEISWLQWHNGTNVLVAASSLGIIYMYKIPSGDRKMVMAPFGSKCVSGKILPDGKSLCCGYQNGNVKIIDLKTGTVLKDIKPQEGIGKISCIDVHKSNNLIICGCEDGEVVLINSNSGKLTGVLQCRRDEEDSNMKFYIEAIAFCKDPSYPVAASGSLGGHLIIWDIVRQTMRYGQNFPSCINHLIWHPNLPLVFSCHVAGVVRMYDAKAGAVLNELSSPSGSCLNMAISSDGETVLTTSEDGSARIFSVSNFLKK